MNDLVYLSPDEVVPGRPFCHPQASVSDVATLQYMIARLRSLLTGTSASAKLESTTYLNLSDADGAAHRLVLPDRALLQRDDDLVAVGFFGQIRPDVDHTPIMDLENELMDQLPDAPGLLTYYNLHRPGKGYGNLVLFQSDGAKDSWRDNKIHDDAVRRTPNHYFSVRLHNGLIRGGIINQNEFELVRTK